MESLIFLPKGLGFAFDDFEIVKKNMGVFHAMIKTEENGVGTDSRNELEGICLW